MRTIIWLSILSLCLMVLLSGYFSYYEPPSIAQQKQIGWKPTAEKIRQLERVKKETFDAIKAKSQGQESADRQQQGKEVAQSSKFKN